MRWRRTMMIAAIACLGGWASVVETARSEPVRYRLEIKDTGPRAAQPAVMVCALETRCVGRLDLLINDKPRSVSIVAAVSSGYAFVGFFDGPAPLLSAGRRMSP